MVAESFVPNEGSVSSSPPPGGVNPTATSQLDGFNARANGSILERISQTYEDSGVLRSFDGKVSLSSTGRSEGSTEYQLPDVQNLSASKSKSPNTIRD